MNMMDDSETTKIIARSGPKVTPFRTEPAPAAAVPPAPVAPPAPVPVVASVVLPPDAVRPRPVMTPPGIPARADVAKPVPVAPVVAAPALAAAPVPAPIPAPVPPVPQPVAVAPAVLPAAFVVPPKVPDVPAVVPALVEPVTGWLVVLKGPGRGASLALRAGRNALGSGADQDLVLAFGDPAIAAAGHAYLVYDDEARGFFIEDGKKKDLVRLNGQMLTETRPLASGDEIRIGQTTLRFVAFCGAEFDWAEPETPAKPSPIAADPAPEVKSVAPEAAEGEGI